MSEKSHYCKFGEPFFGEIAHIIEYIKNYPVTKNVKTNVFIINLLERLRNTIREGYELTNKNKHEKSKLCPYCGRSLSKNTDSCSIGKYFLKCEAWKEQKTGCINCDYYMKSEI